MPIDYSKGKIYSIRSYQTDMVYIGSTCSPLHKRLYEHKKDYERYIEGKRRNITSFQIIVFEDVYIELLEEYPCENKQQLCKREGELIRETHNCINKVIQGRTQKEWYKDNKEVIYEKQKKYVEANKDNISQRRKIYYIDNKEKFKQYHENNKEQIKEQRKRYRENNKEVIAEKQKKYYTGNKERMNNYKKLYNKNNKELITAKKKQYYESNKNTIKSKNSSLVQCNICRAQSTRQHLKRHQRTKKCMAFLSE